MEPERVSRRRLIKLATYLIPCMFLLLPQCWGLDDPQYTLTIPSTLETVGTGENIKFMVKVDQNTYEVCPDCSIFFYLDGPERTYYIGSIPYSFLDEARLLEYGWVIPPWIPEGEYVYYAGISNSRGALMSDTQQGDRFFLIKDSGIQRDYPAKITELKAVSPLETGDVATFAVKLNVYEACEGCKLRFYVDGVDTEWNTSHWVGVTPYSGKGLDSWFEYKWEIPSDLKPGTYEYSAVLYDSGEKIQKSPWSASSKFQVLETNYLMKITGLIDINTMQQGDIAVLGARVTGVNNYPCSDCNVWFYIDGPKKDDERWVGPVKYDIKDKDKWFKYQWEIPADSTTGTYTYSAKVFGETRKIEKSKASGSDKFTIKASGNLLKITNMRDVGTVEQGEEINLAVKLKKIKDDECGDCYVRFRVTKPDGNLKYLGKVKFKEEYVGKWLGLDWKIPENMPTGIYYYQARVTDPTGKINKSAWSAKKSFEIKKKTKDYILEIDYLLDMGTVEQGDIIELGAKIDRLTNDQCIDCRVWYWLDAPGSKDDRWLGWTKYNAADPLNRYLWRIPYDAVTGIYRYKVRVFDKDREVRRNEFSEIDEFKVVKKKYYLKITDISTIASARRGDTVEFKAKVESLNDADCEDCSIWFYIAGPKENDDRWVGPVEYDSKDSDKWFSYRWNIPEDIYIGTYTVKARVFDQTRKFRESVISKAVKFQIVK